MDQIPIEDELLGNQITPNNNSEFVNESHADMELTKNHDCMVLTS